MAPVASKGTASLRPVVASTLLCVGCATAPSAAPVAMHAGDPRVLGPSAEVSRVSLPDGHYSGLAIEPDGRRLVLTDAGDVMDVATGIVVRSLPHPTAAYGYTDWVSLGDGRFAVTAMSNGFLSDPASGELQQHFCYEPGSFEDANDAVQVTWALGVATREGRLYAQPLTLEQFGFGGFTGSFLASYDLAAGADLQWWQFPDSSYRAGGLAVLSEEGPTVLLLGSGNVVASFDTATSTHTPRARLEGVALIEGLAIDRHHETLLVLDGERAAVVELPLAMVAGLAASAR